MVYDLKPKENRQKSLVKHLTVVAPIYGYVVNEKAEQIKLNLNFVVVLDIFRYYHTDLPVSTVGNEKLRHR